MTPSDLSGKDPTLDKGHDFIKNFKKIWKFMFKFKKNEDRKEGPDRFLDVLD